MNTIYDLGLDIPETLKIIQLSEKNRRLVLIAVQGLRRVNGSLLPEYTEEEFQEATFSFVKYYVQSRHYDELVAIFNRLSNSRPFGRLFFFSFSSLCGTMSKKADIPAQAWRVPAEAVYHDRTEFSTVPDLLRRYS